jgi:hypothetical protein
MLSGQVPDGSPIPISLSQFRMRFILGVQHGLQSDLSGLSEPSEPLSDVVDRNRPLLLAVRRFADCTVEQDVVAW